MGKTIEIDVVAGLCRLKFQMGCRTGRDDQTNPGVGFSAISSATPHQLEDGTFWFGSGVITRDDAMRLRDELEIFLKNHEAGVAV